MRLQLHLPGCISLKEKRSRIKPLMVRLHREFNISVAEVDRQDAWQEVVIACAMVSNDNGSIQRSLQSVVNWVENSWIDVQVVDEQIELI